jgi:hypothetical protein
MSVLEKRLQVLIDAERWDRLEAEAARTGRSIGAIVRSAIDLKFAGAGSVRAAAAHRLLEAAQVSADDWDSTKRALQDELAGKLG